MISIARHIELLLLEHDCVIVPGLGGFITNHADARYTGEEEGLFLPPYRTIGFNQQLQVNDGLLVQSYMAAYDTSYPAANLQMEKDLEKMMNELEMKGEYELENIGIIKKGLNQNISFISPETGALTPSLYGLYSYEMKSLQHVIKEKDIERNLQAAAASMHIAKQEKETSPKPTEQKAKRGDVIIHFNRRWLDMGIAAAAAVLLFFCFSYLVMNQPNGNSDTIVAAFPTMDKVAVKPAKPATVQPIAAPVKNEAAKPVPAKAEPAKASEAKENPAQVEKTRFAIVLATYVSQDNAEKFIKDLAKEGLSEGRYVKNGKVSRVLYSEYADESAAQQALNKLRQENAAFAEAWILEL
ncbi:MAG: SPOR domain-containing protein [Bacteroidaceae bacterium]|nr:SPOR domain-containing protein [Bacteroidaceae bacterium]